MVDRLTKTTHLTLVKVRYPIKTYVKLYISPHKMPIGSAKTATPDKRPQFVARFWEQLQESLGTMLIHSSAYHPQTSG